MSQPTTGGRASKAAPSTASNGSDQTTAGPSQSSSTQGGGTSSASSAGVVTTQAEKDAQERVESARTDPAVANAGPSGGAVAAAPIVNEINSGPTAEEAATEAASEGHATGDRPMVTRAEGQEAGTAGFTAPGDAPFDTTDPRERLTTIPASGDIVERAAKAGLGSFVSAVKTGEVGVVETEDTGRTERYEVLIDQAGTTATMERNMDTGVSRRVGEDRAETASMGEDKT